jgi:AcrR family transcriptional regulator
MLALSTSKVDSDYIRWHNRSLPMSTPKSHPHKSPARKPARRYHHGDLRRTLVETALAIVESAGPGALSLRELARRAGVSHAAPYRHFPSREALLVELASEGFRGLAEESQARVRDVADPLARLRALGVAYVRYAVAHPGHFRVMFSSEIHEGGEQPELAEAGAPTLQALVDVIAECQAEGLLAPGDPRARAVPAWSMVHGLAMLIIDRQLGPLVDGEPDVEALAAAAVDVVVRGHAPEPRARKR